MRLAGFTAKANLYPTSLPFVARARARGVLYSGCICGRDAEYKDVVILKNATPQRGLSWLFVVEGLERTALGLDYIRRGRNPGDSWLAQFHPRAH